MTPLGPVWQQVKEDGLRRKTVSLFWRVGVGQVVLGKKKS